jgi:uncharacterized membrane protein (UPF0127 family)
MWIRTLMVLLGSLAVSGCKANPEHWVQLKGERYAVELALTEEQRQQGLMRRDSLPARQGMLFVFEREQPLAFWMKNTLIPLDILYFDDQLRLVSVARSVPPCKSARCPSYPSTGPALFALELNAGEASRLGVRRGDALELGPGIPRRGEP